MTSPRPVRALSFHATYKCRHSGACCTSNWPIPIEADRLARVRAALASGRLRLPRAGVADIFTHETSDDGALLGVSHNACVFFGAGAGHLCAIQRVLGHDALPLACRQFPRVTVADPRGISVTLSHYCPTAGAMLASESPVAIVTGAAAFPNDGEYVGLDATTSLPPLLRPGILMDWESWWEVERLAVTHLSRNDWDLAGTLTSLAAIVEDIRAWRPEQGALLARVRTAFETSVPGGQRPFDDEWRATSCAFAIDAVPSDLRDNVPTFTPGSQAPATPILRRFLAAHAFANWTAHLAQGLRSWLRSIEVAYALAAATGSISTADLVLRHLVDPAAFASRCGTADTPRP